MLYYNFVIFPSYFFYLLTVCHHNIFTRQQIAELNNWENELLKKVDDKFLNWYFSYGNQKLMEFGVPFAWAAFKLDSVLKVLRKEDEKDLNAEEIIKNRMIEDFNHKFQELVLNDEAEKNLKRIV